MERAESTSVVENPASSESLSQLYKKLEPLVKNFAGGVIDFPCGRIFFLKEEKNSKKLLALIEYGAPRATHGTHTFSGYHETHGCTPTYTWLIDGNGKIEGGEVAYADWTEDSDLETKVYDGGHQKLHGGPKESLVQGVTGELEKHEIAVKAREEAMRVRRESGIFKAIRARLEGARNTISEVLLRRRH